MNNKEEVEKARLALLARYPKADVGGRYADIIEKGLLKFFASQPTLTAFEARLVTAHLGHGAVAMQSAVNLSGVLHSVSLYASVLWSISNAGMIGAVDYEWNRCTGGGTDWVNYHPVMLLSAAQIAHLTGGSYDATDNLYSSAYAYCEEYSAKRDEYTTILKALACV